MTTDPSTDPLAPGPVFDPTADLPEGTTVLEASAGTGKTHAIAATTARLVALGRCRIDRVMLVTFARTASLELRSRVHERPRAPASSSGPPRAGPPTASTRSTRSCAAVGPTS